MDARKIKMRNSRSIPALLKAARSKDDELARRAIEALGKVGTASTLARLGRLRGTTPRVRKSIAFARSLLAHRHGVKGWALKLPRGARMMPFDSDRAVALSSKSLPSKEWPAIKRSLRVVKEVVPPADKPPLAFQCGSEQYLLLVNPLLERGVSAMTRPLVAAALVKFSARLAAVVCRRVFPLRFIPQRTGANRWRAADGNHRACRPRRRGTRGRARRASIPRLTAHDADFHLRSSGADRATRSALSGAGRAGTAERCQQAKGAAGHGSVLMPSIESMENICMHENFAM